MERQWLDLSGTHLRETSASAMNGCLGSFEEAKVLSPPSPPSGAWPLHGASFEPSDDPLFVGDSSLAYC